MILVSTNVRFMQIFAVVPQIGAPNDSAVLDLLDDQTFPSKFLSLKPTFLYSNSVPRQLFSGPKMCGLE